MNDQIRAKVFLSCGQRKSTEEPQVAERVQREIEDCGFHCYMAIEQHSLRSLKENIFSELEDTDYLIFIDFKREPLDATRCRGSLFTNQELAIASFLDLPILPFQEKGVVALDGMLGALQVNTVPFGDKEHLHTIVRDAIQGKLKSGEWKTASRSCLTLDFPEQQFADSINRQNGVTSRYYQIKVTNNHARKAAVGCFAYLETVQDLSTGERFSLETAEFKWSGSLLPGVRISPGSNRRFDAFHFPILSGQDEKIRGIQFNVHIDSTQFYPWQMNLRGKYEVTYLVASENFPEARKSFILEFGDTLGSIRFVRCSV